MKMDIFQTLTGFLIRNGRIEARNEELYLYGMWEGMLIILNVVTALSLGMVLRVTIESIIFLVAFIPLRSYAGGAHARTHLQCYCISVVVLIVLLGAIKYVMWTRSLCGTLYLIASIITLCFAPIANKNKPLNFKEKVFFKKKVRFILVSETAVFILALILNVPQMYVGISVASGTLSGLLVIGKGRL